MPAKRKRPISVSLISIILFTAAMLACDKNTNQKEETSQRPIHKNEENHISIEINQAEVTTNLPSISPEMEFRVLVTNEGNSVFKFDQLRAGFYYEGELVSGCTVYGEQMQGRKFPAVMFSSDTPPVPPEAHPSMAFVLGPGESVKLPISTGPNYEFAKTTGIYGITDSKKREVKIRPVYKGKTVAKTFILEVPKELPYRKGE